jgi:hypothetical protein
MPTMSEVGWHVQIRRLRAEMAGVLARDMEAFDETIITSSANLGLPGASTSREDDAPDRIEMPTQSVFQFKVGIVHLLSYGIEGELLLRTSPTG